MKCQRLAEQIEKLDPTLPPLEVARLCLLLLNSPGFDGENANDAELRKACKAAAFRFKASADQHDAVSQELEELFADGPQAFNADQIWLLVRAIKVQSQILDLYTDQPAWV